MKMNTKKAGQDIPGICITINFKMLISKPVNEIAING